MAVKSMAFNLTGLKELKMNLEELGAETATKIGRKADREAAQLIAEEIRKAVPYDPDRSTKKSRVNKGKRGGAGPVRVEFDYGHWRDNIRVAARRARKAHHIVYHVTMGKAFWSYFYEMGTKNQPARPIVRMTFDHFAKAAMNVQIDVLKRGIVAAAKKLARSARKSRRAITREDVAALNTMSAPGPLN